MISKRDRDKIVRAIVDLWERDQEKHKRLELLVADFFEKEITSTELLPMVSHRIKSLISMIKTAIRKEKTYGDITDKLGFRIVCHFKSELPVIKKFIEASFEIVKYESKAEKLKFDTLGYVSDHYDVRLKADVPRFAAANELHDIVFEIQVRTICQHAWADVEHSLSYKQDADLDNDTKRRVFRLTSLLEICDDEFDSVNQYLLQIPESRAFAVLRCVEGKFYRYAKRAYDRDLSFSTIDGLLDDMSFPKQPTQLCKQLNEFLETNDTRIQQIFSERQAQIEKDLFLSQPEVLFIWYLIQYHRHDLIPAWRNQFDIEDLKDLSIIWGVPVMIPE